MSCDPDKDLTGVVLIQASGEGLSIISTIGVRIYFYNAEGELNYVVPEQGGHSLADALYETGTYVGGSA